MTIRHTARWLFLIVTLAIGISFGESVSAKSADLSIGPIPVDDGREVRVDDLPDLIPLYGDGDEVLGYVRAEEAFGEQVDPSVDVVAMAVYKADGVTLVGHEILGKGFVPGTEPIETTRAAVVPPPLD